MADPTGATPATPAAAGESQATAASAAVGANGKGVVQEISLYEIRKKIYPRAVSGWFATWRWALVWFTMVLFYGLPWLSWNDRQAVLFDLEARRFFIFGIVLNPQDFIYLTGLLVISALALFLFTAVAGRLWCGYACPQTVYTEIFLWIEAKIEGNRNQRIKLDNAPMSGGKFGRKAAKHAVWILFALWTGFTFVGYFTPVTELAGQVITAALGPWQTFWILFYGFATYGNAGFMREQVCKYMCPYARFQSAMFDKDTLIITYDEARGEPRGKRGRKADPAALGLGSCIDCGLCVEVCPTGIDIRKGLQYECIGCAGCVDACNQVMDKMGYERGLIRYDTTHGVQNKWSRSKLLARVLRPRVLIYTTILFAIAVALLTHVLTRVPLKVDVIRDRGALARIVEDGLIENVFRLQVINSAEISRRYTITVGGLEGIRLDSDSHFTVDPAANRLVPVRVRAMPQAGHPGSNTIEFTITADDDPNVRRVESASFFMPRQ
ncbi:MAG: cytochrome c oxidase accessory protein CcoG [Burkholderiaceae bacterium]